MALSLLDMIECISQAGCQAKRQVSELNKTLNEEKKIHPPSELRHLIERYKTEIWHTVVDAMKVQRCISLAAYMASCLIALEIHLLCNTLQLPWSTCSCTCYGWNAGEGRHLGITCSLANLRLNSSGNVLSSVFVSVHGSFTARRVLFQLENILTAFTQSLNRSVCREKWKLKHVE